MNKRVNIHITLKKVMDLNFFCLKLPETYVELISEKKWT